MNDNKHVKFTNVSILCRFKYDGDLFVKTDVNTAWELKKGVKYKLWGFVGDELVFLVR